MWYSITAVRLEPQDGRIFQIVAAHHQKGMWCAVDQSGFAHIPAPEQREESKQSPNGREFKYRKEFESRNEYAGGTHEQNEGKKLESSEIL